MGEARIVGDWSNEDDIMDMISSEPEASVVKIGGSSFCHKIFKVLSRPSVLVKNFGHDCMPPDYYSDELSIMFDVMRVNDSEVKKGYNPAYQELSSLRSFVSGELSHYGLDDVGDLNVCLDLSTDNGANYDDIHQLKYYKRQTLRVLRKHLNQLSVWQSEHPSIQRKGFVVFDEAGIYFRGKSIPLCVDVNNVVSKWLFSVDLPLTIYYPWYDFDFMQMLVDSKLDFVVWYKPYVQFSLLNLDVLHGGYPHFVIIDVRKPLAELQKYEDLNGWSSCS